MLYIIVQFYDGVLAYRECTPEGEIMRYTDMNGVTLDRMDTPHQVPDSNPPHQDWMI